MTLTKNKTLESLLNKKLKILLDKKPNNNNNISYDDVKLVLNYEKNPFFLSSNISLQAHRDAKEGELMLISSQKPKGIIEKFYSKYESVYDSKVKLHGSDKRFRDFNLGPSLDEIAKIVAQEAIIYGRENNLTEVQLHAPTIEIESNISRIKFDSTKDQKYFSGKVSYDVKFNLIV